MKTADEQNEAGMLLALCIILALVMMCCAPKSAPAQGVVEQGGNLDQAMSVDEIPEGKCMWTAIEPPLDRLVYPKQVLLCRTLNVVSIVKVKGE